MPVGVAPVPRLPNLKTAREAKFLTQEMLARQSGVSRPSIARLERGDVDARFSTIWKLANALGVEPGELTGETAK